MPGGLIPDDLTRIQEYVGDRSVEFVLSHFVASEGAKVMKVIDGQPAVFNIPSLVPAQQPDGRCVFLTANDKCGIHPVAPFGCSHCDTHMTAEECDRRMTFCVTQQAMAHCSGTIYAKTWQLLHDLNLRAKPLVERRADMKALMNDPSR